MSDCCTLLLSDCCTLLHQQTFLRFCPIRSLPANEEPIIQKTNNYITWVHVPADHFSHAAWHLHITSFELQLTRSLSNQNNQLSFVWLELCTPFSDHLSSVVVYHSLRICLQSGQTFWGHYNEGYQNPIGARQTYWWEEKGRWSGPIRVTSFPGSAGLGNDHTHQCLIIGQQSMTCIRVTGGFWLRINVAYFRHTVTWKQEIHTLWDRGGETRVRTTDACSANQELTPLPLSSGLSLVLSKAEYDSIYFSKYAKNRIHVYTIN